jgi:hypothetical protein
MVLTLIYCLITDRTCITRKLEEKRKATHRITASETMLCSASIISRICWRYQSAHHFRELAPYLGILVMRLPP